ncbi:MAG: inositol monophosphatase family protein [bacterium]
MSTPATRLHAVARQAAQRAGAHVLAHLGRRGDIAQMLPCDIKHTLDLEAQEVATATIRSAFPDHAILGEETADAPLPATDVRWVIDPIDGTVNFTHGLPLWCCSVAAQINEVTVAGVVFAPELGLLFEAHAGGDATCNGQRLCVSGTTRVDQALVHTGADKNEPGTGAFRFFSCIAGMVQRPRVMGSAALDICWVAAGRADGYFEPGIYIWDMAAAGLILECAGGRCEVLRRGPGYKQATLATNGRIHQPLRDALTPLL